MIARSVAPVKSSSLLHVNMTPYSTPADTVEHDAMTYTLKANALLDGQALRIRTFGYCAANTNYKSVRLKVGNTYLQCVPQVSPTNNQQFTQEFVIVRTSASAGISFNKGEIGAAVNYIYKNDLAENFAADLLLALKAQNGTASAGDIIVHGWMIEILR